MFNVRRLITYLLFKLIDKFKLQGLNISHKPIITKYRVQFIIIMMDYYNTNQ